MEEFYVPACLLHGFVFFISMWQKKSSTHRKIKAEINTWNLNSKSRRVSYILRMKNKTKTEWETIKEKPQGIAYFYVPPNFLNIFLFYLNNFHPLVDEWEKNIFKDFVSFQPFFFYLFIFIIIIIFSKIPTSSLFTSAIHKSFSSYSSSWRSIILYICWISHCLLCISTRRTTVIMMMRGRKIYLRHVRYHYEFCIWGIHIVRHANLFFVDCWEHQWCLLY